MQGDFNGKKLCTDMYFCLFMEQIINFFLKCFCNDNDLIIREEKKHHVIMNSII